MKRHTTARTIGFGCILLAISGCGINGQYRINKIGQSCDLGLTAGYFGNPAVGLLGCAAGVMAYTIGAIAHRNDSILEPTTAEPTVVRWDVTYAPLPTPGDTPTQPESTTIPIPPPTPHN